MKAENVKTERSFWAPFLVGGLIGAGAALLLAPKTGRDLRKDIEDAAGSARKTITESVEKGRELYEQSRTAMKGAIEAGKTAFVHERDLRRRAA